MQTSKARKAPKAKITNSIDSQHDAYVSRDVQGDCLTTTAGVLVGGHRITAEWSTYTDNMRYPLTNDPRVMALITLTNRIREALDAVEALRANVEAEIAGGK